MAYKLISSTMRNTFHCRLLLISSRVMANALINSLIHAPGCSPASQHSFSILQRRFLNKKQNNFQLSRKYENTFTQLPCLMNNPLPTKNWPQLDLKSELLFQYVVSPHFHKDFNQEEFIKGAKHALLVISEALSQGDISSVEELFTKEAHKEIKENMKKYSRDQLTEFAVDKNNVLFAYLTHFNSISYYETGVQREFVEISVYYCLEEPVSIQNGVNPTAEREKNDLPNLICCLIRFICEITKDVEDQWSVNMIHHYKF